MPHPRSTLIALGAGLLVGIAIHWSGGVGTSVSARWVEPLGTWWVRALSALAIPLAVILLFAGIVRKEDENIVRVAGATLGTYLLWLALGSVVAFFLTPVVVAPLDLSAEIIEGLGAGLRSQASELSKGAGPAQGFGSAMWALVSSSPIQALRGGQILPILLWTLALALLVNLVPIGSRRPVVHFAHRLARGALRLTSWLLWFTPIAVFALMLGFARQAGITAVGVLGYYTIAVSGLLLGATLVVYPLAAVFGGVSIPHFAQAAFPAQAVALSTRSSLAALPAMLQGAEQLQLPTRVSGFVLPFAVSAFKPHRSWFSIFGLMFLAHIYGVAVPFEGFATFAVTIAILSFASAGVPGGLHGFRELPGYIALGIPIEGYVMLQAVDVIPDIFKTVVNVTADLGIVVWVTGKKGRRAADSIVKPVGSGLPDPGA